MILIDADLQDPPHVMHAMIAKWREGYDVVYGTRTARPGETAFKLITARAFYRLLNKVSEVPIPLDTGDFRLMSRKAVDALNTMPERARFIRGMVSWIGFKQIALPYERAERFAGTSKYPLRKMIRFATDGIMSFSTKPLQISITIGVLAALLAFLGLLYTVYIRFFTDHFVAGWAGLMVAMFFMGGVQLISIGVPGEYIGRIYTEIKGRPLYIVDERIGFEAQLSSVSRSPLRDTLSA